MKKKLTSRKSLFVSKVWSKMEKPSYSKFILFHFATCFIKMDGVAFTYQPQNGHIEKDSLYNPLTFKSQLLYLLSDWMWACSCKPLWASYLSCKDEETNTYFIITYSTLNKIGINKITLLLFYFLVAEDQQLSLKRKKHGCWLSSELLEIQLILIHMLKNNR